MKSKTLAASIFKQLSAGNDKTWCTLAKKYSEDPSSKDKCGKLTVTKGETVPVFDKVAFSQPTKKVHAPVYDAAQYKAYFIIEPLSPIRPAQDDAGDEGRRLDQADAADDEEERRDDHLGQHRRRRASAAASRSSTRRATRRAPIRARPSPARRRQTTRPPSERRKLGRRRARRASGADRTASPRLPVGSRADREDDRAAHRRGGLRGRRRRPRR